ncbi:MAG: hypothetical protein WCS49_01750 [Bacilli bacterium]
MDMKELALSITHYKVLHTIASLNDLSLYPNQEGVYKILSGIRDNETKEASLIPTFGTLISYSSKKICHYVLALSRYEYLKNIFDPQTEELYLEVTPKGRRELELFLKKKRLPYSKTIRISKPTITKIIKK